MNDSCALCTLFHALLSTTHGVQDVGAAFNFPPTITSVSFSLRKAYVTHLWDYEQVGCSQGLEMGGLLSAGRWLQRSTHVPIAKSLQAMQCFSTVR